MKIILIAYKGSSFINLVQSRDFRTSVRFFLKDILLKAYQSHKLLSVENLRPKNELRIWSVNYDLWQVRTSLDTEITCKHADEIVVQTFNKDSLFSYTFTN